MEHRIREAKGTILIYKGEPICYNILNTFAEQLGEALQKLGEEVEYFDVKQSGEAALAAYAGKTYQAVIGFQSYLFDIYLPKAGIYLHDLIKGPKINFQFDHPIWMKNHYIRMPEHCYSATHDRNYAAFIEKYYPRIAGSSIIFPGGCEKAAGENGKQEAERNLRGAQDKKEYQISFIGTYTDYRSYLPLIRNSQGIIKKIAAHFLFQMKQHPEETAEKALEESLRKDGIVLSDEEFLEVLDGVKPMIYCIMSYYREKAVKVILEAGITLEELHGNRQPDTDEYLLSIIKGMNWEIQVLNGTMDYLNEIEQLIDKQAANALFVNFSKIYQKKDDEKLAEVFEKDMIPFFEKLEEVAKVKMN